MNHWNIHTICCFLIVFIGSQGVLAQKLDLKVAEEILIAANKEQQAFQKGDCDAVLAMMEDDITLLANGRRLPSKEVIGKFCKSMKRPFPGAKSDNLEVHPLTENSGYVIRTLEYTNKAGVPMKEHVTKIWTKKNGEWKISHLHSTIKEVKSSTNE